jgi:ADP-heptose:LPS heptosyltransferase
VTTVLFVRLSAMGDLVQGLGAIAALHAARPQWRLRVLTQTTFAPLLQHLPFVAGIDTFDRRSGLHAVWATRRALRREPIDIAIDLQGNWKSAFLARLAKARDCVGLRGKWRQEPLSSLLLRRRLDAAGEPHPARAALALVREFAPEAEALPPQLVATPTEIAREQDAVRVLGIAPERPFAVVAAGDPADPRSLRPHVIAALRAQVAMPLLVVMGPAEAHVVPVPGLPLLRHERGELRRLVALGACVALAGGEVLGSDQGASHVLAAAGARARVWFGAQDPARTAPPTATSLVHPSPPSCSPCRRRRCHHAEGPVCMDFTLADAKVRPPAG